jgi:glycosyltransferase 2 family protein
VGFVTAAPQSTLKKLIPIAKILVALGLIAFVIWLVPMKDHVDIRRPDGTVKKFTGEIRDFGGAKASTMIIVTEAGEVLVALDQKGGVTAVTSSIPEANYVLAEGVANPDEPGAEFHLGLITVAKNASLALLGLGFVFILIATFVAVYRWYLLLNAADLATTLPRVTALTFIGAFFNNVMPGSQGGDIVKAFYIAREHRSRKTEAIITVLLDRILGITGLTIVAGLVIPFDFGKYFEVGRWIYGLLVLEAAFAAVFFSRRLRRGLGIEALIQRMPGGGIFKKVDEAVFIYRYRKRTVGVSLVLSLLVHTVLILGIGFIGRGVGFDTPMLAYFVVVPVGLIIMALPIAPSGWGAGEAAFIYFWGTLGVSSALALSLLLIYRIEQMIVSLIGGIYLAREKNRVSAAELEQFAEGDNGEAAKNGSAGNPG